MEGGQRVPLRPIRAISRVESRSTQSIRLRQSIYQSISQSMVYEDKEMVNKLTIMNQRETIPIEIPFRVQRKVRKNNPKRNEKKKKKS